MNNQELIHVPGRGGVYATMLLDSISPEGDRLSSVLTRAPKFIDAEVEKHRRMSKNSSSDRAIPFHKLVLAADYKPFDIRRNQPGMQGYAGLSDQEREEFLESVESIRQFTANELHKWSDIVHKQHLNRYLLGFSWQYKIITATDWTNFFDVRLAGDVQPEMYETALCIKECMNRSTPRLLLPGQWHLPLVDMYDSEGNPSYYEDPMEAALVSAGRCARTSYKNHDGSNPVWEKDLKLAHDLIAKKHPSPFENQATPMKNPKGHTIADLYDGETHIDKRGNKWSANFKGWVQHRQLLEVEG